MIIDPLIGKWALAKPFDLRRERRVQYRYWKTRRRTGGSVPKHAVIRWRFTTISKYEEASSYV